MQLKVVFFFSIAKPTSFRFRTKMFKQRFMVFVFSFLSCSVGHLGLFFGNHFKTLQLSKKKLRVLVNIQHGLFLQAKSITNITFNHFTFCSDPRWNHRLMKDNAHILIYSNTNFRKEIFYVVFNFLIQLIQQLVLLRHQEEQNKAIIS